MPYYLKLRAPTIACAVSWRVKTCRAVVWRWETSDRQELQAAQHIRPHKHTKNVAYEVDFSYLGQNLQKSYERAV